MNIQAQELAKLRWSKPNAHQIASDTLKRVWTDDMKELAKERAGLIWTKEKRLKHSKLLREKRAKQSEIKGF